MQINANYSVNGVPYDNKRKQNNIPQFSTEYAVQENENINQYMAEPLVYVCDCYQKFNVVTGMPKSNFGDSFGYDMQKDISSHMTDFYAGKVSRDELNSYFEECCTSMRTYRTSQHQTSGTNEADNTQIVSEMYEVFAKENARAASQANYQEGKALNEKYYSDSHSDWTYYNSDYYYQCNETNAALRESVKQMIEKWDLDEIDCDKIEANSSLTLDGGFDFNSTWNFEFRNQAGRSSLAKESAIPPENFKMFFKEQVTSFTEDNKFNGNLKITIGENNYDLKVPFQTLRTGKVSRDELNSYFEECCTSMRTYRTSQHQTSGTNEADNTQIVSEMYEVFAKENARAASQANYQEGKALNEKYYSDSHSDWTYYNSDYYYQCNETNAALRESVKQMIEKWDLDEIDCDKIEANSSLTLDGGFDFNSTWNFEFRNQAGRSSLAKESAIPPENFKMFFKEQVTSFTEDNKFNGNLKITIGENNYDLKVPFQTLRTGSEGEICNVWDLMEDYYPKSEDTSKVKNFLGNMSVFTRWYAYETRINDIFGDYEVSHKELS